jgi:hypothetical protein
VDVDKKPVPSMANVRAAEVTMTANGERLLILGTGLFTVKLSVFDLPPPGEGFVTTTG